MLEVVGLQAGYSSLQVLRGLSFDVPRGETVALLGGNGVGKTTAMKAIVGLIRPTAGKILLDGISIEGQSTDRIFARGVALVPQGRELFPEMTVAENIELGGLAIGVRPAELRLRIDETFEMFPRLQERARERAASLSGGEQQMLATGRALVSRPSVLLMDEPTTGLAPLVIDELIATMHRLNQKGQTILLVEQNVKMALRVASSIYVMRGGAIVAQREARDIADMDKIFEMYVA